MKGKHVTKKYNNIKKLLKSSIQYIRYKLLKCHDIAGAN